MRKIFDSDKRQVTRSQEEALMRAFEEFDSDSTTITAPKVEHLQASRKQGYCCDHSWRPVQPTDETMKKLRELFDEPTISSATYCTRCGAVGLVDALEDRFGTKRVEMWAYDATARFGLPEPKRKQEAKRDDKRKRA